nr:uncharacterized protein LOC124493698 [Dermatophagoides farinae]
MITNNMVMMGWNVTIKEIIDTAKTVLQNNERTFLEESLHEKQPEENSCHYVNRANTKQINKERFNLSRACVFCQGPHETLFCNSRRTSNQFKLQKIAQHNLCYKCLKPGHTKKTCRLNIFCNYGRAHAPTICDCYMSRMRYPTRNQGMSRFRQQKWQEEPTITHPPAQTMNRNFPQRPKALTYAPPQVDESAQMMESNAQPEEASYKVSTIDMKQPTILTTINGKRFKTLLDSGSTINLMSRKISEEIKARVFQKQNPVQVKTIGNSFQLQNMCEIPVQIGTKQAKLQFLIIDDMANILLLGLEAWKIFELSIISGRVICQNVNIEMVKPWRMKPLNDLFRGWNNKFEKAYYVEREEEEETTENQEKLDHLLAKYQDVFSKSSQDIGQIDSEKIQ